MPRNNEENKEVKLKQTKKKRRRRPRFVDYSVDKNFKKLTERQQFYVKEMASHFRMDIRNITKEDYKSLPKEMKSNVLKLTERILSGEEYRAKQSIAIDNYISALKFYGEQELADYMDALNDKLSETDKDMFMREMPSLMLFYKDKVQLDENNIAKQSTHHKREEHIYSEDIDFQLAQARDIIIQWYDEYVKEDKKDEEESL